MLHDKITFPVFFSLWFAITHTTLQTLPTGSLVAVFKMLSGHTKLRYSTYSCLTPNTGSTPGSVQLNCLIQGSIHILCRRCESRLTALAAYSLRKFDFPLLLLLLLSSSSPHIIILTIIIQLYYIIYYNIQCNIIHNIIACRKLKGHFPHIAS
jgi:hypothetical protein